MLVFVTAIFTSIFNYFLTFFTRRTDQKKFCFRRRSIAKGRTAPRVRLWRHIWHLDAKWPTTFIDLVGAASFWITAFRFELKLWWVVQWNHAEKGNIKDQESISFHFQLMQNIETFGSSEYVERTSSQPYIHEYAACILKTVVLRRTLLFWKVSIGNLIDQKLNTTQFLQLHLKTTLNSMKNLWTEKAGWLGQLGVD